MKFKFDKYKYYTYTEKNGTKVVVAVATYAGRTVKGYAKCNPNDTYDEEAGKKLAAARCQERVSKKRKQHATRKFLEAAKLADEAHNYFMKMRQFYMDADDDCDEAIKECETLLVNIG